MKHLARIVKVNIGRFEAALLMAPVYVSSMRDRLKSGWRCARCSRSWVRSQPGVVGVARRCSMQGAKLNGAENCRPKMAQIAHRGSLPMPAVDLNTWHALWDYSQPAESEQRFVAALQNIPPDMPAEALRELQLILQTQLARTHSLRRQFEQAHALLDAIAPQVAQASTLAKMHHAIERGRTFNSSGKKPQAQALFEQAWSMGKPAAPGAAVPFGQEELAIDALHMIAIAQRGEQALKTNQEALGYVRAAREDRSKRWEGPLLNNMGNELKTLGRLDEALRAFQDAVAPYERRGNPAQTRVVHWHIAHIHRLQGRTDAALAIQQRLAKEAAADGKPDEYVHEELMLLHELRGEPTLAQTHAVQARQLLAVQDWFAKEEAARWQKINALASLSQEK
jgi:tetratricopeptide (TPR) repeat protein